MKKTFLSLFVVALIVVALAAVPAFADGSQCPAGGDHTWVVQSDATYKCSKCNSTFAEEHIHTPGESVIENVTEATCAEPGSYDTVVYCTTCGDEISRVTETIDTIEHTPAAAVRENEVAAKCEEDGSYDEVVYCSVCNAELSREQKTIPATGHTEVVDAAVAATCAKTGLTEGKHCSVCNDILVAQEEVAKIEHKWDEGKITKEATTEAEGEKTFTCTGCGATKTEAIAKLDPIPAEAAKPAAGAKPAAKSATPKTGDESNAVLWLVISVSACACGAVTLLAKRKLN